MLKTEMKTYYKVKEGQSLLEIAAYFCVAPYLLAKENALAQPPKAGEILKIPQKRGNFYTVREGDSKVLLCGSEENYEKWNGTDVFYVGMRVCIAPF